MSLRILTAFGLILCLGTYETNAQSFGHYHLPSTLPQFCGLGYGAGHHAALIRPTQCRPPRMQRYVRMPECAACGSLPMNSFTGCAGAGCHTQLDQLLRSDDYEGSPVTPAEGAVPTELPVPLPESPQIPMLPRS